MLFGPPPRARPWGGSERPYRGPLAALRTPVTGRGARCGPLTASSFTDISAGFFNLGAGLFGPLFNSGENQRRVDAEVARTTQLLNRYEQSILNAYREVEDALVAVRTYRAELDARLREVRAAESAAELSWIRYEDGVTSYLEVLETQRALFTSQIATSQTRQLALTSVVELYAALGGGWQVREDPAPAGP